MNGYKLRSKNLDVQSANGTGAKNTSNLGKRGRNSRRDEEESSYYGGGDDSHHNKRRRRDDPHSFSDRSSMNHRSSSAPHQQQHQSSSSSSSSHGKNSRRDRTSQNIIDIPIFNTNRQLENYANQVIETLQNNQQKSPFTIKCHLINLTRDTDSYLKSPQFLTRIQDDRFVIVIQPRNQDEQTVAFRAILPDGSSPGFADTPIVDVLSFILHNASSQVVTNQYVSPPMNDSSATHFVHHGGNSSNGTTGIGSMVVGAQQYGSVQQPPPGLMSHGNMGYVPPSATTPPPATAAVAGYPQYAPTTSTHHHHYPQHHHDAYMPSNSVGYNPSVASTSASVSPPNASGAASSTVLAAALSALKNVNTNSQEKHMLEQIVNTLKGTSTSAPPATSAPSTATPPPTTNSYYDNYSGTTAYPQTSSYDPSNAGYGGQDYYSRGYDPASNPSSSSNPNASTNSSLGSLLNSLSSIIKK